VNLDAVVFFVVQIIFTAESAENAEANKTIVIPAKAGIQKIRD
jgi:hypothetical protein